MVRKHTNRVNENIVHNKFPSYLWLSSTSAVLLLRGHQTHVPLQGQTIHAKTNTNMQASFVYGNSLLLCIFVCLFVCFWSFCFVLFCLLRLSWRLFHQYPDVFHCVYSIVFCSIYSKVYMDVPSLFKQSSGLWLQWPMLQWWKEEPYHCSKGVVFLHLIPQFHPLAPAIWMLSQADTQVLHDWILQNANNNLPLVHLGNLALLSNHYTYSVSKSWVADWTHCSNMKCLSLERCPYVKVHNLKCKKYTMIQSTSDWPKVLFLTIHMLHLTPSSQCPATGTSLFTLVIAWHTSSRSYPSPVPE